VIVGGTPGGDGQPQWNLQMVTGLIDAGLDVQATVEQPRWTLWVITHIDRDRQKLRISS